MIPGYEGYLPRINGTHGQRFSVAATEGLAKFQMDSLQNRRKRNVLRHRSAMQEKIVKGRSLGERSVRIKNQRKKNSLMIHGIKKKFLAHNESIQTTFNHCSA